MTAIAFDTLKLAKRLEAAGFPPAQAGATAEALADSLRDAFGEEPVTRGYLDDRLAALDASVTSKLQADLATGLAELKGELAERLAELKGELAERLAALRNDLTDRLAGHDKELTRAIAGSRVEMLRWSVGFLLGQTAVLAALVKLL